MSEHNEPLSKIENDKLNAWASQVVIDANNWASRFSSQRFPMTRLNIERVAAFASLIRDFSSGKPKDT